MVKRTYPAGFGALEHDVSDHRYVPLRPEPPSFNGSLRLWMPLGWPTGQELCDLREVA